MLAHLSLIPYWGGKILRWVKNGRNAVWNLNADALLFSRWVVFLMCWHGSTMKILCGHLANSRSQNCPCERNVRPLKTDAEVLAAGLVLKVISRILSFIGTVWCRLSPNWSIISAVNKASYKSIYGLLHIRRSRLKLFCSQIFSNVSNGLCILMELGGKRESCRSWSQMVARSRQFFARPYRGDMAGG